jgi:hypothetical protein
MILCLKVVPLRSLLRETNSRAIMGQAANLYTREKDEPHVVVNSDMYNPSKTAIVSPLHSIENGCKLSLNPVFLSEAGNVNIFV